MVESTTKGFGQVLCHRYHLHGHPLEPHIREGKQGSIPSDLAPILERLNIDADLWVDAIDSFGQWSRLVVANASRMAEKAASLGHQYLHGVRNCRALFRR